MIPELHLIGIILLSPCILAQMDVKPDVSFSDTNDRFDISPMWADKQMFADKAAAEDPDYSAESDTDLRRHLQRDDFAAPTIHLTRKADGGFAYDDRMDSTEGGTVSDFEDSLKHFQTNIKSSRRKNPNYGVRKRRRSLGAKDNEVLLQHAVPIVFKVDGYLKAPLK